MKKILTTLAILFVVNCQAQDTTFYQKRTDLYMSIRTKVIDSTTYKRYYSQRIERRRRNDRILTIVGTTIFAGLTYWYWHKPY